MSESSSFSSQEASSDPAAARWLGRLVTLATGLGMVLSAASILASLALICYAVVMRHAFNSAPNWVDDTVGFMLIGTVMFAAPATMRQGGHIAVDMLTGKLGPKGSAVIDCWSALAMMAVSLIFIVNGWETVQSSKMLGISTSGTVEIPVYLLQTMMPIGGVLMLMVAIESLLRMATGLPSLAVHGHGPHSAGDEP